eukprot:8694074-Pyramimonas_sp.AAC.1
MTGAPEAPRRQRHSGARPAIATVSSLHVNVFRKGVKVPPGPTVLQLELLPALDYKALQVLLRQNRELDVTSKRERFEQPGKPLCGTHTGTSFMSSHLMSLVFHHAFWALGIDCRVWGLARAQGVVGLRGELDIGGQADHIQQGQTSIPGRRTGSIWLLKKRQKFPYAWQKRLFVLLPTELRLRYFKEDEDALVACGCVDLRSLKWGDESAPTTAEDGTGTSEGRGTTFLCEHLLRVGVVQDLTVTHFMLKAIKDNKDKLLLYDLIRDRLDNSSIQPSLGISYALDNVSVARGFGIATAGPRECPLPSANFQRIC